MHGPLPTGCSSRVPDKDEYDSVSSASLVLSLNPPCLHFAARDIQCAVYMHPHTLAQTSQSP